VTGVQTCALPSAKAARTALAVSACRAARSAVVAQAISSNVNILPKIVRTIITFTI